MRVSRIVVNTEPSCGKRLNFKHNQIRQAGKRAMSLHPLPPNPCLIAVLLVARTTSDPFIVFHYPPKPGEDNSRFKNLFRDNAEESTTSSSDDESPTSATEVIHADRGVGRGGVDKDSPPNDVGSASPEKRSPTKSDRTRHDLFGFQTSVLAKILCPPASNRKKRFEFGLDEKVLLGRPVFAKADGSWRKAKKARRLSSRSNLPTEKTKQARSDIKLGKTKYPGVEEKDHVSSDYDTSAANQSDANQKTLVDDETPIEESDKTGELHTRPKRPSKSERRTKVSKKPLAMFNVICVLQPPPLEYHVRVHEMYDHVVRKLSKALKWEQARSNLMANEIANIVSITKRAVSQSLSSLYHGLLSHSILARAIANVFDSISSSRIAHVNLTPTLSLSLQIPLPTSVSTLPNAMAPQLPGLWLTTANSMPAEDETQTTGSELGSHFTLLLLSDLSTILADVAAAASPITEPLTQYLRVSKPTKSFSQISQTSGISLPDIRFLASHMIYWRRARAIPPLHQRDTYIVSPNADMRNLAAAASVFAKSFPALPSLPHILNMLSSKPRPYSNLIPSKDHKEAYMNILAWLMRGGWVTQLRTFAWIRVPGHIKDAVARQNASPQRKKDSLASGAVDDADVMKHDGDDAAQHNDLQAKSSPGSSASSTHTTVPITRENYSHTSPSLITNPRFASDIPSRQLLAIADYISRQKGQESKTSWVKCLKYLDGRHAVETIPVREGWKRKKVKDLVDEWVELGVLVIGRHW